MWCIPLRFLKSTIQTKGKDSGVEIYLYKVNAKYQCDGRLLSMRTFMVPDGVNLYSHQKGQLRGTGDGL